MGWERLAAPICGVVVFGLGIFLIVLANNSLDDRGEDIAAERERIEDGNEKMCTLSSALVTTDCRDSEYCTRSRRVGGGSVSCANWAPIKLCYCESTLFTEGTKTGRRARFAILNDNMSGDPTAWCQDHLNEEAWPNFLAFNKDGSGYDYCGFRAYKQQTLKLEGTSMEGNPVTCAIDMVLEPDYKCVTAINKGGFPCIETADGSIYAGTKSDLVKQREECSRLSGGQKVVVLILGIILLIFSIVWEIFWLKELCIKLKERMLG